MVDGSLKDGMLMRLLYNYISVTNGPAIVLSLYHLCLHVRQMLCSICAAGWQRHAMPLFAHSDVCNIMKNDLKMSNQEKPLHIFLLWECKPRNGVAHMCGKCWSTQQKDMMALCEKVCVHFYFVYMTRLQFCNKCLFCVWFRFSRFICR